MSAPGAKESTWRGWLIPGGLLLLAGVLLTVTLLSQNTPTASPSPATVSSPSASALDEHEVVTDQGIVSFRLESDEIVVRLETSAGTMELGRAAVATAPSASPGGSPTVSGTTGFAMLCSVSHPTDSRAYVFGHIESAGGASYSGPAALGHIASDGLFLFALVPGSTSSPILVGGKGKSSTGFPGNDFSYLRTDGTQQPSGCFVG